LKTGNDISFMARKTPVGQDLIIEQASWSHSYTPR